MTDAASGSLADRDWRLIRDDARDGATQMALEEVAAETAITDGIRTVRTFSWEPSTLSLGYRQDAETVDWGFCEREASASPADRPAVAGSITTALRTFPTRLSRPQTRSRGT